MRRGDGLTYEFRRQSRPVGEEPSYERIDLHLFCRRLPDFGWCVVDLAGVVLSRPFDDPGDGGLPPERSWVSRKGDKAYVYDLRLIEERR